MGGVIPERGQTAFARARNGFGACLPLAPSKTVLLRLLLTLELNAMTIRSL
jgi:hypothetical protein